MNSQVYWSHQGCNMIASVILYRRPLPLTDTNLRGTCEGREIKLRVSNNFHHTVILSSTMRYNLKQREKIQTSNNAVIFLTLTNEFSGILVTPRV